MELGAIGVLLHMSQPRGLSYLPQIRFDLNSCQDGIQSPIKSPFEQIADGRIHFSFTHFEGLDFSLSPLSLLIPFLTRFHLLASILSLTPSLPVQFPIHPFHRGRMQRISHPGPPSESHVTAISVSTSTRTTSTIDSTVSLVVRGHMNVEQEMGESPLEEAAVS